jgi:RNA polymerase sigma factor (sigma-70 family)
MEFHTRTTRKDKRVNAALQAQGREAIESPCFSDGELIQQACAGSGRAFEQLVHRYDRSLYRFIHTFLPDYDQANDVFQQVLIQWYMSLPTFQVGKPLRPWLFQVARYRCLDELRRRHALHFSELENEDEEENTPPHKAIPQSSPPLEELAEQQEVREQICVAIRALPTNYRTIVALRYALRLSFGEIGRKLGIPESTAKTYFQRAKPLMQASLAPVLAFSVQDDSPGISASGSKESPVLSNARSTAAVSSSLS